MHAVTWATGPNASHNSIALGPAAILYSDGSVCIVQPDGTMVPREEIFPAMYGELAKALHAGLKPKIL